MKLGVTEIVLIAAIALLLFGSTIIGRFRGTFKKTKKGFKDEVGDQPRPNEKDWEILDKDD